MYLDFYALQEKPFTLSPNPQYLYFSKTHKEAYSQLLYAISEQSGYMLLTGEIGSGKTTVINAVTQKVSKGYENYLVAKVYHTVITPKGLLQNICNEFGVPFKNETRAELVLKLHEYLRLKNKEGKRAILIIDEAQNLREEVLEEIRLLSNIEAVDEKFLQIILAGHPELNDKLQTPQMQPFQERIGLRYHLERLDFGETNEYIRHRLSVAGIKERKMLFTEEALKRIYAISEGVPRRINLLCENALLIGFAVDLRTIDAAIIEEIELKFASVSTKLDEFHPLDSSSNTHKPSTEINNESNRKARLANGGFQSSETPFPQGNGFSTELDEFIKEIEQPEPEKACMPKAAAPVEQFGGDGEDTDQSKPAKNYLPRAHAPVQQLYLSRDDKEDLALILRSLLADKRFHILLRPTKVGLFIWVISIILMQTGLLIGAFLIARLLRLFP